MGTDMFAVADGALWVEGWRRPGREGGGRSEGEGEDPLRTMAEGEATDF